MDVNAGESREPSYYEIALTNRQVVVAFVVLLVCLLAAFFSGVWIGRGAAEAEVRQAAAPQPTAPAEGTALEELEFFEQPATGATGEAATRPSTTLREDLAAEESREAEPAPVAAPRNEDDEEPQRREERAAAETTPEDDEETAADEEAEPEPAPARERPQRPARRRGRRRLLCDDPPPARSSSRSSPRASRTRRTACATGCPRRPQGLPLAGRGGGPHDVPRPHRPLRLPRGRAEGGRGGCARSYKLDTWVTTE